MSLSSILENLDHLVSCDTQNPPRCIDGDAEIFAYCESTLDDQFTVKTWDHGDGHVSWYAKRGTPKLLFNVHLDTVPCGEGWTTNPLKLDQRENRLYGRGTCDIKGAAAVLLSLAQSGVENMALLFTTDEEGAGGCCVKRFTELDELRRYQQVIVAEPTGCQAVLQHRGYLSVKTRFYGKPGHSSEARTLNENANHMMANWSAAALELARGHKTSESDPGSCFNIGIVDGGSKSNVIAGESFVHWSARLKPGDSNNAFLEQMQAVAPRGAEIDWQVPFAGEPLPAGNQRIQNAEDFCEQNKLTIGTPVDFWTEASLFSAAGLPAMVLGPGHIEQAHIIDEWVAVSQLEQAWNLYAQLVNEDE